MASLSRKEMIRNRHIRGTAKIAKIGDKLRSWRLRLFGNLQQRGRLCGEEGAGDGGAGVRKQERQERGGWTQ